MAELNITCLNPLKPPGQLEKFARCRVCKGCVNHQRMEWANRMKLEQFGLDYKPFFVTPTYAPKSLPENHKECIDVCQKWFKRMRRKGLEFRYFLVTENGDKYGRLHQHLMLWSKQLSDMDINAQWRFLYDTWGHGRLESEPIRKPAGFNYISKYIVKNFGNADGKEWSRVHGKYVNPGRLYTWSNKPVLGYAGTQRWKNLVDTFIDRYPGQKPPNWINMPLFGELQKVYIPSDTYKRYMVQRGIKYSDNVKHTKYVKKLDFDEELADSLMKAYADNELWHENAQNLERL